MDSSGRWWPFGGAEWTCVWNFMKIYVELSIITNWLISMNSRIFIIINGIISMYVDHWLVHFLQKSYKHIYIYIYKLFKYIYMYISKMRQQDLLTPRRQDWEWLNLFTASVVMSHVARRDITRVTTRCHWVTRWRDVKWQQCSLFYPHGDNGHCS